MEPESFYRGGQADMLIIFFPQASHRGPNVQVWSLILNICLYGHTIKYFLFLCIHIFLCVNNLNSAWFLLICARPSAREMVTQFELEKQFVTI